MTLMGLTFAQLALLFAGLATAITVLYVLKLRRRIVQVPFARLWDNVLRQKENASLFQKLKRLLSLLLQLCFVALILAALGDPQLSHELLSGRHVVILLDTSASMKTTDGVGGERRMATAKRSVTRLLKGMSASDSVMLVGMDAQVTPLSPYTSDHRSLIKLLKDIRASDTEANLERALRFTADSLRGRKRPRLVLVGDGAYDERVLSAVTLNKVQKSTSARQALDRINMRGIDFRYLPVGFAKENLAIVAFNARRYRTNHLNFEIFLEVVNYGDTERDVDLQLFIDGELSEVRRLNLKAQQRMRYSCGSQDEAGDGNRWCNLAATGELLEARLVATDSTRLDAFPLDDRAKALLPKLKKMRVLLVSGGNLFLEGALLLDENLTIKRIGPAEYSETLLKDYDAIVFDGFYPQSPPTLHTLLLNPPMQGGPFQISKRAEAPLINEINSDHPVMRWITLKDVNISSSALFERRPGDIPLASSFRQPVLIARETQGQKIVAFGFDTRSSDLPLRVAFPMLVINTFQWFTGDHQGRIATYQSGKTWRVPVAVAGNSKSQTEASVVDPLGKKLRAPVHDGFALVHGRHIGLYRLNYAGEVFRLVANLTSAEESKIAPRPELTIEGQRIREPEIVKASVHRGIWIYLLLAALVLSLVEWLTYNRRLTV